MLRVIIADDESLARDRLRKFLAHESDVEILAECVNGLEVLEAIYSKSPDLVFLDITMPLLDGINVLSKLPLHKKPAIILVTAHSEFALQAFDLQVDDYLLKPFSRERFQQALALIRNNKAITQDTVSPEDHVPFQRFAIKLGKRIVFVNPAEVEWIQSADNYTELHVGRSVHLLRQTMDSLEKKLAPFKFYRISRSILLNFEFIKEVRPKSHGDYEVVLQDGTTLPGTRNYRKQLFKSMKEMD